MGKNSHPGRFLLLGAALVALLAAMWAGLLRMAWHIPSLQTGLPLAHGPLMVSGFLGTLISLERAVALNRWWSYLASVLTAAGTLLLLTGLPDRNGVLLIVLGSAALVGNFAVIIRRQPALFTLTMGLGAVAWLVGNLQWFYGVAITSFVYWWAGFLVLTIAGERLELSRLSGRRVGTRSFLVLLILYLAGLTWHSLGAPAGLQVAGAAMLLITLLLVRADVVRRTVRVPGLPRFIAIHLLCGYAWLAIASLFWVGITIFQTYAWQAFHYDAMLHAIFLGFVFSMIFAHAPIIFPAVTGRPLAYRSVFYVHGILLHLSLVLRIASDLFGHFVPYHWSGLLNVLAVVLFLINNAYGVHVNKPQEAHIPRLSPEMKVLRQV